MAGCLERLPMELIALVASSLSPTDLSALRICSRAVGAKFSSYFFHLIGESRTIILDHYGMCRLHEVTNLPNAASYIRNINFLVPFYHSPATTRTAVWSEISHHTSRQPLGVHDDYETRDWIQRGITEQFSLSGVEMRDMMADVLRSVGPLGEITLEAITYISVKKFASPHEVNRFNWRTHWSIAIRWYRVLMSAMARAEVSVTSLVLFQRTKKCSIPTHEFTSPLTRRINTKKDDFGPVGLGITRFSVSLATTIVPIQSLEDDAAAMDDSNYLRPFDTFTGGKKLEFDDVDVDRLGDMEGVATLLHQMPHLESLDLHLYNTTIGGSRSEIRPYLPLLPMIFKQPFPKLTSLTLQGMPVAAETLIKCLDEHPRLQNLTLRFLFLTSGAWSQVFDRLAQPNRLKGVYFSNLMCFGNDQFGWRVVSLVSPQRHRSIFAGEDREVGWQLRPGDTIVRDEDYYEVGPGALLWHSRAIGEEELRDGINFLPEGLSTNGMASWEQHIWYSQTTTDFGPP